MPNGECVSDIDNSYIDVLGPVAPTKLTSVLGAVPCLEVEDTPHIYDIWSGLASQRTDLSPLLLLEDDVM